MKRLYKIIGMTILFLTGCNSDFEKFNKKALAFVSDNNQIDQKEFAELVNLIKQSEAREFQQFRAEDGKIDSTKIVSYLLKYFSAKKLTITEAEIWQPRKNSKASENFNINVFLENSGSMNGYLNDPNTQFKNSIYSLLTRLKLFVNKDSLNLFLINEDDQLLFGNASNNDVEAFKDILNPASFSKISKGKTSETDINELIKRCIKRVNDRNLCVFISDCIYSPGKSKPDATLYLSEQKHGIYLNFATEIRNRNLNLSVIILQLKGGFKGTYYDHLDNKIVFYKLIERPFYIWFIGTKSQIEKVIQSKILEEIDGGYINKMILQPAMNEIVKYKIMSNPIYGTFDRKNLAKNIIENPTTSKRNEKLNLFGFTIAVDFSKGLQDASYYLDTSNYIVSNSKYNLSIEEITDKTNPTLIGYTHLLKLQTSEIRDEVLKIELIGKTPNWVYKYSSNDDSRILTDMSEQQKTFGLKYLLEGVCDAFYPKVKRNSINTITITIKK